MLPASSAVQQANFSRLLLNKPIQYLPFTDQMRLIQYPRNDQRDISHARRNDSNDVDDWFAGGG